MRKISVLRQLVPQHGVLLHGSPRIFDEAYPQLTIHHPTKREEVAICATPFPEIAIFMGVFGPCNNGKNSYVPTIVGKRLRVDFTLCPEDVRNVLAGKHPTGYVHCIDASGFKKFDHSECRTYESRYVKDTMPVTHRDLPFLLQEGQTTYTVMLDSSIMHQFN